MPTRTLVLFEYLQPFLCCTSYSLGRFTLRADFGFQRGNQCIFRVNCCWGLRSQDQLARQSIKYTVKSILPNVDLQILANLNLKRCNRTALLEKQNRVAASDFYQTSYPKLIEHFFYLKQFLKDLHIRRHITFGRVSLMTIISFALSFKNERA